MLRRSAVGAFALSVSAALATALAAPASAAPAVPNGDEFTLELTKDSAFGLACPFPVLLTGVNGQQLHENENGRGVVLLTGPAVVTATNLDTGVRRTFNISGPTLTDPRTGNLVFVGQTLILQPTAFKPTDPFLRFFTGRVQQTSGN